MKIATDWHDVHTKVAGKLSSEDQRILELLIAGESTPAIARALGQHRSKIWRKAQQLRALARGT